jgi:hypothetical protein
MVCEFNVGLYWSEIKPNLQNVKIEVNWLTQILFDEAPCVHDKIQILLTSTNFTLNIP